jgi:hypothetical protein
VAVENAAPILEGGAQAFQAARGGGTAQHADLDRACGALDPLTRPAEAHAWMGQQREHAGRVEIERGSVGGEPRQPSGIILGQRHARRIVHGHVPAGKFSRDARRQRAVRGHEGGRAARRLQHLAQRDSDGERLLALVMRVDQLQALASL